MLKVDIIYCEHCNYLPRAKELKRGLVESFGEDLEVSLAVGSTGIFDVYLNDEIIFSKFKELRFPELDEIKGKINARLVAATVE